MLKMTKFNFVESPLVRTGNSTGYGQTQESTFCSKVVRAVPMVAGFVVGAGIGFFSSYENIKFTNWLYNENRGTAEVAGIITAISVGTGFLVGAMAEGAYRMRQAMKNL